MKKQAKINSISNKHHRIHAETQSKIQSIAKRFHCLQNYLYWRRSEEITSVWQNLITTQQTFWKQVSNHICFNRTRASCDRKLIRDPASDYVAFAYNFPAWIFNSAKQSSFLHRLSRMEEEIVPDIPDPEEIGVCGAMDFYQQNIWHKVTWNMLLFPLAIGVRQE